MKGGCGKNERCRVGGLYGLVRGSGADIAGPQAPLSVQKREQGHGGGGQDREQEGGQGLKRDRQRSQRR